MPGKQDADRYADRRIKITDPRPPFRTVCVPFPSSPYGLVEPGPLLAANERRLLVRLRGRGPEPLIPPLQRLGQWFVRLHIDASTTNHDLPASRNSKVGFVVRGKFNKCKSSPKPSFMVHRYLDVNNVSAGRKRIRDFLFVRVIRYIRYKDLGVL